MMRIQRCDAALACNARGPSDPVPAARRYVWFPSAKFGVEIASPRSLRVAPRRRALQRLSFRDAGQRDSSD